MKQKTRLKRAFCAFLAAATLLLAGCAGGESAAARPQFSPSGAYSTQSYSRTVRAPLSFLSLDGNHLMVEMRDVSVPEGQTDARPSSKRSSAARRTAAPCAASFPPACVWYR